MIPEELAASEDTDILAMEYQSFMPGHVPNSAREHQDASTQHLSSTSQHSEMDVD